ncbi:hypothetical protein EDD15DRAFT_2190580 [Pisolithus albus]|nr:hypothetical protein EDD15DRAFT_2190580 [Pisolithus albus]
MGAPSNAAKKLCEGLFLNWLLEQGKGRRSRATKGSYQSVKTVRATNQDKAPLLFTFGLFIKTLQAAQGVGSTAGRNEYYKTVTKYCKAAKPSMVSATGTSANGQYIEREGQTAGMLCLARYWHAIGQSKEKAHPDPVHDIVETGSRVFESVDYL